MEEGSALRRVVSLYSEEAFQNKKSEWTARWLVISTVVIFAIETLLMWVLDFFVVIPHFVLMFLDGTVLVLVLLPLNYFYIVRPLARQIDEHRRTNLDLAKSNEMLERFFAISDVLIAYLDTNYNFLRVNRAYANSDQRDPDYFVGLNHFDLFPDEENRAIFNKVVETGNSFMAVEKPFEYAEHPERGVTYWDWSLLPIKDPEGKVVALIMVLTNVTERKRAQLALADSERRFRAVFNQTFQQSALLDPQGVTRIVNQTALNLTGYPPDEVVGKAIWQLPWWDTATRPKAEIEAEIRSAVEQAAAGTVVRCEQRVRSVEGVTAIMDITLKPLQEESGSTDLLIYEARDITERIRSQDALKRSQSQIEALYQAELRAHQFAETLRGAVLALSGSLDSTTVLENLLNHLFKVVPFNSAHIIMLEDEDHLVVRLARGEDAWGPEEQLLGRRYETENLAIFQPLIRDRRVISIPDTLLYPGSLFLPTDEYVRCWLGLPLEAGDQVIGICLLEHECPDFFTGDMINWATALTGQAAVAIQNAWLFEQVRDGREHLQALSRRLVEAQEHERHYIARELHDEAGQALASMKFSLHLLERNSDNPQQVLAQCRELKQVADSVLEDLHRLSINLHPAALDQFGLVAALRNHVETVGSQQGLEVQFATHGQIDRLPVEMETAVYRIVQEALTNIVRHAQATQVGVMLDRRKDYLIVMVEDNGVGFNPSIPKVSHLGVLGIRERADMLGGTVNIESVPGRGTTVLLEIPWPSEF